MRILGFQKLTLLDYPGYVASTIFTGGCNFKCPFCHNASLVNFEEEEIDENYILDYLKEKKKYLDAVCISGGEPTLQKDLIEFVKKIKDIGYLIKLDTNGTNPKIIKELIDKKLIDYVAIDIKNSKERYNETADARVNIDDIDESIAILLKDEIDYEFRTTVVYEFHDEKSFEDISKWLKGTKRFILQQFQDSGKLIKDGLTAHEKDKLYLFKSILEKEIKNVEIKGL